MRTPATRLLALSAVVAGCTGSIGERLGDPEEAEAAASVELGRPQLRRLTLAQYKNSVQDVLGEGLVFPSDLEADTVVNGLAAIGTGSSTLSPSNVEKLERAAFELARQAVAEGRRARLVSCAPSGPADGACLTQLISGVGRKLFRRALQGDEIERYAAVAGDAAVELGDFWAGAELAVAGLLQSPSFLFRAELGEPDPSDERRWRYTAHDMASRLSFYLWNTTPDDALLEAAERGTLLDEASLRAEVNRLLASPRAREAQMAYFDDALHLERLDALAKDPSTFPLAVAGLGPAMREDIRRTIADVLVDGAADYRELLRTRVAYVNEPLAPIYGTTVSSMSRVEPAGPRLGLLGKPGFLALHAMPTRTSPTLRGKFIRESLLCEGIGSPPPEADTEVPEPSPDAPTMRDRLDGHRVAGCAECHAKMDPLGLALESFDGLGVFRQTDGGHALDLSGDLDGQPFDGPEELAQVLSEDPRFLECATRGMLRFALGRLERPSEDPVVEQIREQFTADGLRLADLMRAVATSASFRFAAPPEGGP